MSANFNTRSRTSLMSAVVVYGIFWSLWLHWMTLVVVMAHLDNDGIPDVRCRKITNEAKCRSTSGCAFDSFETKRCLGVHGKSCDLLHSKQACETNYGCRWAFGFVHKKWRATCKPFDFELPAKQAVVFPPRRGPLACASLKKRKKCVQFSGCQPSKLLGCRPQKLILRRSFYFVDGCTQNYGLIQCNNRKRLPYKATFMEFIDSGWYFIDRVEILTPVTVHPNQTITPSDSYAKVFVWYAHDQVKGRYFVYDLKTEATGSSVFTYEAINGRKICRASTQPGGDISTLDRILRISPGQIIGQFGSSSTQSAGFMVAEDVTTEFGVDTGNASQYATATGTGPPYLILGVTSDIIADTVGRFQSFHSDEDCEPSSRLEEAFFPAILKRKDIGLGDGSSNPNSEPVDPCFAACLELANREQKQQCVLECARQASENQTRLARNSTERVSPDGFIWEPELTIRQDITQRFNQEIAERLSQIQRIFSEFCGTQTAQPNVEKLIAQTEALIQNLNRLEQETLLPLDINLGKVFTIVSLVGRIKQIISLLDAQLGDLALILQLTAQIPILQPIVLPISNIFNQIRANLITVIKTKLNVVANALQQVRGPVLEFLGFNVQVRKLVLLASAGVETFVTGPIKIADCSRPVDAVAEQIVDSNLVSGANTVVRNAISGLGFARELTEQVGRIVRNVESTALEAIVRGLNKLKEFWDNTIGRILYPLQNALNHRIRFEIPWFCETRIHECVKLPCGTETCSTRVWCGVTCKNWRCRSKYCTVDIPCGIRFCETCATVTLWLPCLKEVSFTIREVLTGVANLLGGGLSAAMTVIRPILDAIPKPTINLPGLPSADAIPVNINGIVNQVKQEVSTQVRNAVSNLIVVQISDEFKCGLDAFLSGSDPVSYWTCPPWNRILDRLLVPPGPLTFTLEWSDAGDMDLMVQTPNGNLISYSDMGPIDGGKLDRDDRVGKGPENIFWGLDQPPPPGIYHVCVHPFNPNDFVFPVDFVLTIRIIGFPDQVIRGVRSGPNDNPVVTNSTCNPSINSYVTSVLSP